MKLVVYTAIAAFAIATLAAQSPPAPTFDVASVKRNVSGEGGAMVRNLPGSVTAVNVPVRQLIRMAYQVQDFQIVEAPDWANTERYDVDARFDPAAPTPGFETPAQKMSAMMRSLLRDRFNMAARLETREMPIYALRPARTDGRLGPQIKPSAVDCAALAAARGRGPADGRGAPLGGRPGGPPDGTRGAAPPPGAPFSLGERPQCGGRGGFGQLLIGGMPIGQFAMQLSQLTGRVVLDRTGLTGGYDIDLKFTPTPAQLPPGPPPPGVELPAIDPNGPSLFTALEEQLGLKLENERGPVDVVVIDRIERPVEN